MTTHNDIKPIPLFILLMIGAIFWNMPAPTGLEDKAWFVLITFILTIGGIITSAMPMGAVTLTSIAILVLTKTLTIKEALSGFGSNIAWLVVIAFFIARAVIKSNLGRRIAYVLISKCGQSTIGLSYSLIFTEFVLAPMIPSTTARGGGIIYPIAQSLAVEYDKIANQKTRISAFLVSTCFHSNVICCALFLTAMAGNPIIANIAHNLGIEITPANWATAAIVPGIINLLVLPFLLRFIIRPEKMNNDFIINMAKQALLQQGPLSKNEKIILGTFCFMIFFWIYAKELGVDATTTVLIGFLILVATKVLRFIEAAEEKSAWETLIWFAILIMLSEKLAAFGVDKWLDNNVRNILQHFSTTTALVFSTIFYFYSHYLFASVTARVTVMFTTFLLIFINLGVPPLTAGLVLAIFSNLSAGLTHYGISSAPVYYGAGYFSTKEWLKIGAIVSTFNFILWIIIGGAWWKALGLL